MHILSLPAFQRISACILHSSLCLYTLFWEHRSTLLSARVSTNYNPVRNSTANKFSPHPQKRPNCHFCRADCPILETARRLARSRSGCDRWRSRTCSRARLHERLDPLRRGTSRSRLNRKFHQRTRFGWFHQFCRVYDSAQPATGPKIFVFFSLIIKIFKKL